MRPVGLRTEHSDHPLGIDTPRPRLSWRLEAPPTERDQRQTAYQLQVLPSSDSSAAALWDSGIVRSADSVGVRYSGAALASRTRYWWRVKVWDQHDRDSDWSDLAWWEMGLLDPSDWRAQWIGMGDPDGVAPRLEGANRIWTSSGDERARFRHTFHVPHGERVVSAWLRAGGPGDISVSLNEQPIDSAADVADRLRFGENLIEIDATSRETHGGIVAKLSIALENDAPIVVQTDDDWLTSSDDQRWRRAERVGRYGDPPWGREPETSRPAPLLRTSFTVEKPVRQARLYSSALGIYEASLNGQPVSTDVMAPGWTDYPTRVPYQVYDVTELVRQGENVLGAMLGDGWYVGYLGFFGPRRYGTHPMLIAQLEVDHADGTRQSIVSDASWLGSTGEIVYSDSQMGETVDARRAQPGWNAPGFSTSGWQDVSEFKPRTRLEAQVAPPMAVQQELRPTELNEPMPGVFVFDLGQNIVGWVRLKVQGERGRKVILRFAEVLNPDGTLYTENLRSAQATDEYILRGDAQPELFEPRFTHHGFRYVEVTGYPGRPSLDSIIGCVVYATMPLTGSFECSNSELNRLQQNIQWGQRGNFLSVPTDCPQRDERLGWTGDAQVFCATAGFNMDVQAFLTKWMVDVMDAQLASGAVTHYAPNPPDSPRRDAGGAAGWADAVVIVPWTLYQIYGDTAILEQTYDACARWIAYMERDSTDLIRPAEGFGDWLSINAETPKDLIGTAYFAYSAGLMSEISTVVGRADDARHYADLSGRVREAFRGRFVRGGGRIEGDTQTGYVLALFTGMLDEDERPLAAERLAQDILERNVHLSTGFLGTPWLMPALTDNGQLDLAFGLLLQGTMPSWIYPIRHGATTMWERWDSWTEGQGPVRLHITPGRAGRMNSFNHYAYGCVGDWLYRVVGGIECAAPGYAKVRIQPRPGGGITWAKCAYESVRGRIACDWSVEDGRLRVAVEIPANVTAEVCLPRREGEAVHHVGSGRHDFDVALDHSAAARAPDLATV